jgi:carbonic anhydrase/acetyltransferase-like protein (isoleucine patch superfamily)
MDLRAGFDMKRKGTAMPLYALGSFTPDLPDSNEFWIAPDANIIGKVRLEDNVGIWFGATLRGDNEWIHVGKGSNVQEGTIIHTDMGFPVTLGENCTIGHHAIIHGCTIGNNSLIGMGATVLNGAKIGNNCLVGANALVTEGKDFPDNSLIVGSPARAIRTLDDDAIAILTQSALGYVENWKRFRKDLKPL